MTRAAWLAVLLAAAGLALPAGTTAAALAGADSPLLPTVATGFLLFKGMLLVHAALVVALSRSGWLAPDPAAPAAAPDAAVARTALLLVALMGAGLALRLPRLGDGLWYDEIQTLVDYVRLPLGRIVTTYDSTNQHLLYSIGAHLSAAVAGESGWSLRFPAVVFGVASLPAAYLFASRLAPRPQALLTAALLCASYHHVWFSQNARGYTGLLLFSLLGTAWFLDLLAGTTRRPGLTAAGYAVAMALATYTHVTAAVVVVAHGLVWLAMVARHGWAGRRWGPALAGLVLAGTLSLQLYAPVLPQLVDTVLHPAAPSTPRSTTAEWKSPVWFVAEALRGLAAGLPGGWAALAGGVVVALAGMARVWRQRSEAVWLVVLPGALTAGALLAMHHNLWPRFFFFAAGFGALVAVVGTFAVAERVWPARGRVAAALGLAGVAALSATTVPRAWAPKQDFGAAGSYVDAHRAPDDAVVTVDLTRLPYDRYYGRDWPAVDAAAGLEAIERAHPRTWVLYTFPIRLSAELPDVWARLGAAYDTAAVFPGTVGGGAVVVMVSRTPARPS